MTRRLTRSLVPLLLLVPSGANAQLPTSQPALISIVREEVKLGRDTDHARVEAGWPAAYEKAKSPDYYLAMTSMTGTPEAWYVAPHASHAAIGDSMKREDADAVLSAELARLRRADADVISSVRIMHARARTELSFGAYPDMAKQRFFEVTWFRVRPGHEAQFETAAKAYGSSARRAGIPASYRVYEVIAGATGPTYLIFSSFVSMGEMDTAMTAGDKIIRSANQDEGNALQKLMLEGVINTETQRFRLDPVQSYVPKETRDTDKAFWMPKRPATVKPTPQ